MSSEKAYTDIDLEIGKLFDSLRRLRTIKKELSSRDSKTPIEIDGVDYDAECIVEGMLAFKIRDFKERADMDDPFYADLISQFEQLPGMADTIETLAQIRADRIAAG